MHAHTKRPRFVALCCVSLLLCAIAANAARGLRARLLCAAATSRKLAASSQDGDYYACALTHTLAHKTHSIARGRYAFTNVRIIERVASMQQLAAASS